MTSVIAVQRIKFVVHRTGRNVIKVDASLDTGAQMCISIDDYIFREVPPEKYIQRFNIPASWNGNKLKGKTQTNYYILDLAVGEHELMLTTKGEIKSFSWSHEEIGTSDKLKFDLEKQADNLERQPFVNYILVDLPLARITGEATISWRTDKDHVRGDGDDIKLLVDGKTYTDDENNDWMWTAEQSLWGAEKRLKKSVCPALDKGIHYVEFLADRSPTLHRVIIETQPSFEGDFWLNPCIKKTHEGFKSLLGVYLDNDDSARLTNESLQLYYRDKSLELGKNAHDFGWPKYIEDVADKVASLKETRFDFSGHWLKEDHWFYYGIDGSWLWFQERTGDKGIYDYSNWKLIRKQS